MQPISREALVAELADRISVQAPDGRLRVVVDGAPAAEPGAVATAVVDALRERGRPAVHIRSGDFLRPASLRLEFGRYDPDAFYTDWLDTAGLRREVLDPAGPGGSGRVLPTLFDVRRDRATRAAYVELPPTAVVLVSGELLLGAGVPFDLSVHLALTPAALARRTPDDARWTLPAYARYADEVDPATVADVVVRCDDPRRPALVLPS